MNQECPSSLCHRDMSLIKRFYAGTTTEFYKQRMTETIIQYRKNHCPNDEADCPVIREIQTNKLVSDENKMDTSFTIADETNDLLLGS